jgi:hypothetical protein
MSTRLDLELRATFAIQKIAAWLSIFQLLGLLDWLSSFFDNMITSLGFLHATRDIHNNAFHDREGDRGLLIARIGGPIIS